MLKMTQKQETIIVPPKFGNKSGYKITISLPHRCLFMVTRGKRLAYLDLVIQNYTQSALIDFTQFSLRGDKLEYPGFEYYRKGRSISTTGLFDNMVFEFNDRDMARRADAEFSNFQKYMVGKTYKRLGESFVFEDARIPKSVYDKDIPYAENNVSLTSIHCKSNIQYILKFSELKNTLKGWFFIGLTSENFPDEIKDYIAGLMFPICNSVTNKESFICIVNAGRYAKWKTEPVDLDKAIRRFLYGLDHKELLSWYGSRDMYDVLEKLKISRSHQLVQFDLPGEL